VPLPLSHPWPVIDQQSLEEETNRMAETPFGYISPIGPALIQPLVKLVETLMAEPAKAPNDVQTSRNENGYSAAIIVLAALVFESGIAWVRYHERDTGRKSALGYFLEVTPESPLTRAIRQVFVIRDVLAHSHLWEGQIVQETLETLQFVSPPALQAGYGDLKFHQVLDPQTRQSTHLKLNLLPSRIWRQDAYLVLHTVAEAFKSLEARDPAYHHFVHQIYGFQGRACTFDQIIDAVPNPRRAASEAP
jgi:hypothetical protein